MTGTGVVIEIETELHQMVENALLVARDQIVTDLGQFHSLYIAGNATQYEDGQQCATNDPDQSEILLIEDLVDHRLHHIGQCAIRSADDERCQNGDNVILFIFADVFRHHAPDYAGGFARIDLLVFLLK